MPRDEMHNTIHDKSHNLSGNNLLLANEQWFKRPKSEREKVPVTFLHLQRASIINIIVAFLVADLPFTVGVLTSTTGIAQCSGSTHFL